MPSKKRDLAPTKLLWIGETDDPLSERERKAFWQKWEPRCPDGNLQRLCHPLGFRERNVGELELRVALGGDDGGVCEVVVDEQEDEVYVRVLVCLHRRDGKREPRRFEGMNCPVRVWLDRPLGDRAVVDVDLDEELPLYTPSYLNGVPQLDYGFRAADRRRRGGKRA